MAVSGSGGGGSARAQIAVVTDSAACLPADLLTAHRIHVVPLRLLADGQASEDRTGAAAGFDGLTLNDARVTTARPAPEAFAAVYRRAAAAGASAVVSVHLSGQLSETVRSAESAAAGAPVEVRVVDSGSIGMGLGFAVLAAAGAASHGTSAPDAAQAASRCAAATGSFFAVDSPRALLAGGRLAATVSTGAAPPASAATVPAGAGAAGLVFRPLLAIVAGRISVVERVRTRSAAMARLAELAAEFAAAEFAAPRAVDLAVQHAGEPARAADLAARLEAMIPEVRRMYLTEVSAAIAAHTGPGMLGVVIAPAELPS